MNPCFFASDLHGDTERYRKLFELIAQQHPRAVFMGGDLMPSGVGQIAGAARKYADFLNEFLVEGFLKLKEELKSSYPHIFLVLGNDDIRAEEPSILEAAAKGVWHYAHMNRFDLGPYPVYGYAHTPPSPFQLKDWERYDVSRFVDPGCVSPLEGRLTVPVPQRELKYTTIADDLDYLAGEADLSRAIFLFHAPPYNSNLDRAALDGRMIDHVPVDVHIGSIAVQRFIENRQPLVTLHGHVHESARLTGSWQQKIGKTWCFTAAHDGPELALITFDPENPEQATRQLL